MSQIQVPKLNSYTAIGPDDTSVTITKLNMYVLAVPGDDTGEAETVNRQAYGYVQRIRRG